MGLRAGTFARGVERRFQHRQRLHATAPCEPFFTDLALVLAGDECLDVRKRPDHAAAAPLPIGNLGGKHSDTGSDVLIFSTIRPDHRFGHVPHQRLA